MRKNSQKYLEASGFFKLQTGKDMLISEQNGGGNPNLYRHSSTWR